MNKATQIENTDVEAMKYFQDPLDPSLNIESLEREPNEVEQNQKEISNFQKFISLVGRLDVSDKTMDKIFNDIEFINSSPSFMDSPFVKLIERCDELKNEFSDVDSSYPRHVWQEFSVINSPSPNDKEIVDLKDCLKSGLFHRQEENILSNLQANILEALYSCFYEREMIYRDDFMARELAEKCEREDSSNRLN